MIPACFLVYNLCNYLYVRFFGLIKIFNVSKSAWVHVHGINIYLIVSLIYMYLLSSAAHLYHLLNLCFVANTPFMPVNYEKLYLYWY